MIEIMCRDDTMSDEDLISAACALEQMFGCTVDVLTPDDIRGMVFWSSQDVEDAYRDRVDDENDIPDAESIKNTLKEIEPGIHMAMLEAGWEAIFDAVDETMRRNQQ